MNDIKELYKHCFGKDCQGVEELSSSGSNRRYFRLEGQDGSTIIGVQGTSRDENKAFITISKHFAAQGLPVPRVVYASEDGMSYLQEDLGDVILFDAIGNGIKTGIFSEAERGLLKTTISMLPSLQFKGAEGLDFSVCYPQTEFDSRMISFDLNYFKYCFLKATGLEFSETLLQDDFDKMSDVLMTNTSSTFLYRDFQSRNVMLHEGTPYFIDFQGGRKGPIYYDVASFLWQAKANFSDELREELIRDYLYALKQYMPVDEAYFRKQLRHFVLFRTLQVLGAYGFRGYFEKKPHFLQSVPYAIDNLSQLLKEPFVEYPYLNSVLEELTRLEHLKHKPSENKLRIKIYSFAYKHDIPYDNSGNGGGYVFDCRSIHNPGRYEHYKHFTGMDKEVIDFLENDGEVYSFLDNVYGLVEKHVETYIERKFANLMVCFGCTGGQHRSVYCAESLASRLAHKYNVEVTLVHREQRVEKKL